MQARALVQLDRLEDAERQLLGLLQTDAGDVEAHGLLVQLRQLRGDEEPLAASPPRCRGDAAFAAGIRGSARDAATESIAICGALKTRARPMLLSSLTTVLRKAAARGSPGRRARSIARLPDDAVVAENFVVAALRAGAAQAVPVIEKFRARQPRPALDHLSPDIARLRAEENSRAGLILPAS